MKRFVVAVLATLIALGSTTAYAAWTTGSSGSGTASAQSVGVPTSVTAVALTYSSVKVSWSAPAAGPTPAQYQVLRTAPTSGTVCTVSAPTATCTDSGLSGSTSYSYTVTSLIGTSWTSGPSATASATTPAGPTFKVVAAAAQTAGTAFTATITATTNGVTTDTTYAGVKTITFSGPANAPSGAAPTYPATVTFTSGVGTASITLVKAETVAVGATDGTRSGSATVTVGAGTAAKLGWSSSTPACATGGTINVGVSGTFTTKVTAYDTFLNPKTGARTVTVSRSPALGSLSATSLPIAAANSETTASTTYTRPGNSNSVTVTAASSGMTSVTCTVNQ